MKKLKWYQYFWYSLMFPVFGMIGDVVTLIAVFTKVTWKPIPHNSNVRIEDLDPSAPKQEEKEPMSVGLPSGKN